MEDSPATTWFAVNKSPSPDIANPVPDPLSVSILTTAGTADSRMSANVGVGVLVGVGAGVGVGVGEGVGRAVGVGVGLGVGVGAGVGVRGTVGVGLGVLVGNGVGEGAGISVGVAVACAAMVAASAAATVASMFGVGSLGPEHAASVNATTITIILLRTATPMGAYRFVSTGYRNAVAAARKTTRTGDLQSGA